MENMNIVISSLNHHHTMIETKTPKFQEDTALLNIQKIKLLKKLQLVLMVGKFSVEKLVSKSAKELNLENQLLEDIQAEKDHRQGDKLVVVIEEDHILESRLVKDTEEKDIRKKESTEIEKEKGIEIEITREDKDQDQDQDKRNIEEEKARRYHQRSEIQDNKDYSKGRLIYIIHPIITSKESKKQVFLQNFKKSKMQIEFTNYKIKYIKFQKL